MSIISLLQCTCFLKHPSIHTKNVETIESLRQASSLGVTVYIFTSIWYMYLNVWFQVLHTSGSVHIAVWETTIQESHCQRNCPGRVCMTHRKNSEEKKCHVKLSIKLIANIKFSWIFSERFLYNNCNLIYYSNCNLIYYRDGNKMSKRLKNYPDPMLIVHKYGADALR